MKRPMTLRQYMDAGMTRDEAVATRRFDKAMHAITDHIVMSHNDAEWRRAMLDDCVDALYERVEAVPDTGSAESMH